MSAIQPGGSAVTYASGNYINHVAIYIGDGKIIHSSNPTTGYHHHQITTTVRRARR
ncbi:MAG: NlpC/P60 family protein [Clostridium sp.]